jgi:hypothetical protein
MKVLSGDSEFFEDVFRNFPGSWMCISGKIPMLGTPVEFFDSSPFIGNRKPLFKSSKGSIDEASTFREYHKLDVHLEVSACQSRVTSENVASEDNIQRELASYQKLLAEIIPTPGIARLPSERGNVSLAVQMATIPLMNFVRFSTLMEAHQSRDGHAKEGVVFGRNAIAAFELINRDRQSGLRLRVAVHMRGTNCGRRAIDFGAVFRHILQSNQRDQDDARGRRPDVLCSLEKGGRVAIPGLWNVGSERIDNSSEVGVDRCRT